jgi:arsenite transporter
VVTGVIHLAARNGRALLVLGLLAGALLPAVAVVLRPWLPELVALLLFLTALRVGPGAAVGSVQAVQRTTFVVLALQAISPLVAIAIFTLMGVLTQPFALAIVLMLAAPSVTGAPSFLIMMGKDPAAALRILVLGTAIFPVTVIPVLFGLPNLDAAMALGAALRLVAVILCATAAGFLCRQLFFRDLPDKTRLTFDGLSALALAVIVVGLMSEIGPLFRSDPARLGAWATAVLCLNFGLQITTFLVLRRAGLAETVAVSVISGNRNIALFLIALPPETTGPLLVFIGCYQIPMYLTPIILRHLYASFP